MPLSIYGKGNQIPSLLSPGVYRDWSLISKQILVMISTSVCKQLVIVHITAIAYSIRV